LCKNVARILTGRWEDPASAAWWRQALLDTGFEQAMVSGLAHEGRYRLRPGPRVAQPARGWIQFPFGPRAGNNRAS
jgi:hypothetical protein